MAIEVAGSPAAIARTRATAEELFARLEGRVRLRAAGEEVAEADSEPPLVVARIDLTDPLDPRLVVIDGTSGRQLDRRAFPTTESLENSVEAVAHVTYLIVESLLEPWAPEPTAPEPTPEPPATAPPTPESDVDSAPPQAAEPEPLPLPPPVPPTREVPPQAPSHNEIGVDVGVAFSMVTMGTDRLLPGGGLAAEVRWGVSEQHVGLLASVAVHGSTDVTYANSYATLRPLTFRLLPTYDHAIASGVSLVFGAGGGADCYTLEPYADGSELQATARSTAWDPVLSVLTGIRVKLGALAYLTVAGGLDVDLAPSRFVVQEREDSRQLLVLPRVRPTLLAALSASLSGHTWFEPSAEIP